MATIDRIVHQKAYWIEKQHLLITKMSVASFEGDEQTWNKLLEDFTTYAIIIKRFDERLRRAYSDLGDSNESLSASDESA